MPANIHKQQRDLASQLLQDPIQSERFEHMTKEGAIKPKSKAEAIGLFNSALFLQKANLVELQ